MSGCLRAGVSNPPGDGRTVTKRLPNCLTLQHGRMPVIFEPVLNHVPAWLTVFFRITGILVLAPMFGSRTIPARIRVLLALGLSVCVPDAGHRRSSFRAHPAHPRSRPLALEHERAVAMELMLGVVIGYATLLIMGLQIAPATSQTSSCMGLVAPSAPSCPSRAAS